jgi:hypothetical protein
LLALTLPTPGRHQIAEGRDSNASLHVRLAGKQVGLATSVGPEQLQRSMLRRNRCRRGHSGSKRYGGLGQSNTKLAASTIARNARIASAHAIGSVADLYCRSQVTNRFAMVILTEFGPNHGSGNCYAPHSRVETLIQVCSRLLHTDIRG